MHFQRIDVVFNFEIVFELYVKTVSNDKKKASSFQEGRKHLRSIAVLCMSDLVTLA